VSGATVTPIPSPHRIAPGRIASAYDSPTPASAANSSTGPDHQPKARRGKGLKDRTTYVDDGAVAALRA